MNRAGVLLRQGHGVLLGAGLAACLGAGSATLARAAAAEGARLWAERRLLAFDDLLVGCALAFLAMVAGWLALSVLLTALTECLRCTHTLAGRLARRITPRLCRRILGGACGFAALAVPVGAVPAASAAAPIADAGVASAAPACGVREGTGALPAGLPLPDRPVRTRVGHRGDPTVVVSAGDTLWSIAARHLPPHATDAEVADAWPEWFETNRARLGPDPHLIHPQTRLAVPERFRPDDKDRNR